jgi:hypothetical protein
MPVQKALLSCYHGHQVCHKEHISHSLLSFAVAANIEQTSIFPYQIVSRMSISEPTLINSPTRQETTYNDHPRVWLFRNRLHERSTTQQNNDHHALVMESYALLVTLRLWALSAGCFGGKAYC